MCTGPTVIKDNYLSTLSTEQPLSVCGYANMHLLVCWRNRRSRYRERTCCSSLGERTMILMKNVNAGFVSRAEVARRPLLFTGRMRDVWAGNQRGPLRPLTMSRNRCPSWPIQISISVPVWQLNDTQATTESERGKHPLPVNHDSHRRALITPIFNHSIVKDVIG